MHPRGPGNRAALLRDPRPVMLTLNREEEEEDGAR